MPCRAVLLLASLLAAAPAAASGICDPEHPEDDFAPDAGSPDAGIQIADAIVPCAMAENGFFGPACADAPVYVVTTGGVVLCQVNLAVVAPSGAALQISARPVAPLSTSWSFTAPHAVAAYAPRLPAPVVDTAARCPVAVRGPPADVPPDEVWGPS
jgi:hypothetical protein